MKVMAINKSKTIILALALLLIVSVGYIIFERFQEAQQQLYLQAAQSGYNKGIQDTVVSLYQQTNNCQLTTINIGNVTRQIVDVECVKAK